MAVKKAKKKKATGFFRFIKWFWILFAIGILSVTMLFLLASWGAFGPMPPPQYEYLENPQTNLATEIISSDGKTLGKFYLDDNRTPVPFDSLPENLVNALIATEDARFYEHSGIDAFGVMRAIAYLGTRGGASTITQQLARQLFVGVRSKNKFETIKQKAMEWVLATRLERQYTKEEIIAMYLNQYDFLYNADGIPVGGEDLFWERTTRIKNRRVCSTGGDVKKFILLQPNPKRRTCN